MGKMAKLEVGTKVILKHSGQIGTIGAVEDGTIWVATSDSWLPLQYSEDDLEPVIDELPATEQPATPATDAGGWEQSGAYSHKAGAIQWSDGYKAIKQFAESATGHEGDSRFMHETLNAIHAIAAQEVENAKTVTVGTDTLEHARALMDEMNKQHAALKAENARLKAALETADATIWKISQRLPMTDSYKDVNANRVELRKMAHEYLYLRATATDAGAGRDSEVG